MTFEIVVVLAVLAGAVALFVSERLRVDLVAILVLLVLAISGVIAKEEAIAGFSNHAVITIASVLVLSGSLQRTGFAHLVGRQVLRWAGTGEARLVAVMMTVVGLLSGIMNDIGVTALMLPVVVEIARRIGQPPSKLLMPLAFGSLLGGMTTLIGTTPNILLAGALEDHGLEPFTLFDFTPVGLTALAVGVIYMVLVGRRLLPRRQEVGGARPDKDLERIYDLRKVFFTLTLPRGSALAGKSLAESRVGRALGLNVLAILREGRRILAPGPGEELKEGDALMVEGRLEQLKTLRAWRSLVLEESVREDARRTVEEAVRGAFALAEAELGPEAELVGKTLETSRFRQRFGLQVLAVVRGGEVRLTGLRRLRFEPGDVLLVSGPQDHLAELEETLRPISLQRLDPRELARKYRLLRHLHSVRVPAESLLAGKMLAETRLGDAFGLTVLGILRDGETVILPPPAEEITGGDSLLVQGRREDLEILGALQELEVDEQAHPGVEEIESETVGVAEVLLAPRSRLIGQSLKELRFRDRYGVTVIAVWRRGQAYRSGLARMKLDLGDAVLVYGERRRLALLAREGDFIVVGEDTPEVVETHKAPRSALIMAGVLLSVITGLLPIYIAAPAGAAAMVLAGCVTMEDAYRFIEWKAVLLIAGMLSLGLAMERSGAAELIAHNVLGSAAAFGTTGVIAGLFFITALSAQIMPTAAVAVLMAPIALTSAPELGLSPYALLMVVAVASSCAFMSPVGHPVNLLVMGLGGYRFTDYTRVGLPLTVLIFLVVLFVLPLVWPLTPG